MIRDLLDKYIGKKIAVIGIGNIGQEVILYFKAKDHNNEIICLVDDGYRKERVYQNVSILEMSEFIKEKNVEDYVYINTITSVETETYHQMLIRNGIKNVIDLTTEEIQANLSIDRVKRILHEYGIALNESELKVGAFIFPNPFLNMPLGVQMTFSRDAGDLIFPIWLDDERTCISGPYESEHVKINEGDIVIDIGANIGIGVANAIAKGCGKVYAIEPIANDMIKKCEKMYGEKMEWCEYAIGGFEGSVDMWVNPKVTRNSSVCCKTNDLSEKKEVSILTLDQFIVKKRILKVDFIKIYLDDQRLGIIKGAKNTLRMKRPKLAIFPYTPQNIEEFRKKVSSEILKINPDYKIEYHYDKVFAYV